MVLAMIGLTVFVIAMIASYSGAFAKPTLHHMTVAVAGPEQMVDGIREPGRVGGHRGRRRRRRPRGRSSNARPMRHSSSPPPVR